MFLSAIEGMKVDDIQSESMGDSSVLATGTRTPSPERNKWITLTSRLTVHCSY